MRSSSGSLAPTAAARPEYRLHRRPAASAHARDVLTATNIMWIAAAPQRCGMMEQVSTNVSFPKEKRRCRSKRGPFCSESGVSESDQKMQAIRPTIALRVVGMSTKARSRTRL